MNEYRSATDIKKDYNVSTSTLRIWAETGKIRFIRYTEIGKRYYNYEDVNALLYANTKKRIKTCIKEKSIIYTRVSSRHQKEDLEKQVQYLQKRYPEAEIIEDIGSSLNYKRTGLIRLLEKVYSRKYTTVVIKHKDILDRFAFDLLETIFKQYGVTIEVVSAENTTDDGQKNIAEMAEDILGVVNYFVAKNNGRSAKNKKEKNQKDK